MLTVEPAKPLHNAQIGRSFYFKTFMKTHFEKSFLQPQEYIELLKNRGLLISNEAKAESYLRNIGYFRLTAYFYPLLDPPKDKHIYKKGSSFKQALNMYRFDRKLRLLVFNEIEKIEVSIRCQIANISGVQFNTNLFWLTDNTYFSDSKKYQITLNNIKGELDNSKEDFITHFKKAYIESYPPAWMITEIISFGNLSHIYMNLKSQSLRKKIAKHFGLPAPIFDSWLINLTILRNICCHHARMWNREFSIALAEPKNLKYP